MGNDQKRILMAIVLSAAIIFGWQALFPQQQPQEKAAEVQPNQNSQNSPNNNINVSNLSQGNAQSPLVQNERSNGQAVKVETVKVEKNGAFYSVNSDLTIVDAKHAHSDLPFQNIVAHKQPFQIFAQSGDGNFQKINFKMKPISADELVGTGVELPLSLSIKLHDDGRMNMNISGKSFYKFKVVFSSIPGELSNRQFRNFIYLSDELESINVGEEEGLDEYVKWFGIDFNYNIFLFVFDSKKSMRVKITKQMDRNEVVTMGKMEVMTADATNNFSGTLVYLKKDYTALGAMGDNLDLSVDFGMWSVIAVPILHLLQFFYKMIPNYGIAIIFITFLLRLLTFPLQHKSIKSMNKMKELQPELQKIKEKHKEDQPRAQKETMELFKKNGYNPMGGCLPMILQIPVFFAFYKVLYNAVELVGAPFFGWIQDLSQKDPYYILPVLMGLSFFVQQKLSPTPSTDNAQQKIMMFFPLIFVFIMKDLPSGLTLYIFVSTLLGITQQLLMSKFQKKKAS